LISAVGGIDATVAGVDAIIHCATAFRAVFRDYRQSGHLAPERAVGRVTFEQFLARAHPRKPLPCRTDLE
jgi:hypothetical protein